MIRVTVYLHEDQWHALAAMAHRTGQSRSALVRKAVDVSITPGNPADQITRLRAARGMWLGRSDTPDNNQFRNEIDRNVD